MGGSCNRVASSRDDLSGRASIPELYYIGDDQIGKFCHWEELPGTVFGSWTHLFLGGGGTAREGLRFEYGIIRVS